jgi:DNA-binding PadR family transcriptional regulator
MEYRLTDSDMVLLTLIAEEPGINGYNLRRRVQARGLDAWAGVAASSIYNGLKRIEDHRFVSSKPDLQEDRKGPTGRAFTVTAKGTKALHVAVADALRSSREHDPRFNIALAAIDLLDPAEGARCLRQRSKFLAAEHERISAVRDHQRPLPMSAELLFDRILHALDSERAWTEYVASNLAPTGSRKRR